jgi:hypothetical protein
METSDLRIALFAVGARLAALFVLGASAAWVANDAQERGYSGIKPFVLLRFLGPFGAIIWLMVRPRTRLIENPVEGYSDADDALDAASKLDMLGDWDEAIELYRFAATRWPENESYIKECIRVIDSKKGDQKKL